MITRYVLGFLFLDNPADPNLLQIVLIHKDAGPPNVIGRWNGHGGKLKAGESPTDAMVRETREELQVETMADDWMPFGELRGDGADGQPYVVYLFAGRMPEGQVATQGGREQVGVHVAAECVGEGYVSNIPVLLQAAELALFEPVWLTLFGMRDAGAVRKRLEISALLDKPALRQNTTRLRERTLGDLWDLRNTITEGFWSSDQIRPPRPLSHIAVLPLGQQPDPNCVLRDEEGNPIAGLGLAGSYPAGFVPPGVETAGQQPDPTNKPWTPDPLDDRSDPEIEPHSIGGGGDCEGTPAAEGIQATATLNPPPVFTIDLARYNRSETHPSVPLEDGGELAVATCWTDWRALAADLEAAGMPPELVASTARLGEVEPKTEPTDAQRRFSDQMSRYGFYGDRGQLRIVPFDVILTGAGAELWLNRFQCSPVAGVSFNENADDLELAALALELANDTLEELDSLRAMLVHTKRTLNDGLRRNTSPMIEALLRARRESTALTEEDFEEDGVPVQEASSEELKLSEIYDGHAAAIVAREFVATRTGWTITRILGDARLSTSARALNTPDLPGIRWAAKGEAATTPEERTVKAEWGIVFDGEREAICYVVPSSGPGRPAFDRIGLFWAPPGSPGEGVGHAALNLATRIDWPFVEDSADLRHFEALGFRVIGMAE